MNWDDLQYFLAVARDGQILGAANRLGVSQAKVNRRISALETALDCKLYERSTRGCILTDDGRALMERAINIESETLRIPSVLRDRDSDVSGTIRIGAPDGFGVSFLAPRLHLLRAQFPELSVQLVPVPRVFSLSQREADIAVTIGRPQKGRLRVRKLTDYSLGLFATRDYLATHGTPQKVQDLEQHCLVSYVDDLIFTPELDYTSQIYPQWQSDIEVSSAQGQFQVISSGAGIGVLHDFMACHDPNLIQVLPDITLLRSYWTVWHESMKNSRRVTEVARFLDQIVRNDGAHFTR
ncbi:MAG: LysR family transcriptional regulator [Rhodobacteraceae bacterium]|nr:MAG: LysR family transcriptional regulator [Paracoccaceae bacterium]